MIYLILACFFMIDLLIMKRHHLCITSSGGKVPDQEGGERWLDLTLEQKSAQPAGQARLEAIRRLSRTKKHS